MRLMLPNKTEWEQTPSLIKAFGLENKKAPILSVVGAGGKTSTIEQLIKEYEALGKKIIVTTTTKMYQPKQGAWCREESVEAVDNYLQKELVLWIGLPCGEGKMRAPRLSFLEQLAKKDYPMLIEADGARRLPFKLPGEEEPVILENTQIVVGVLGMTAWNKPWKEVCFRYELASEYLHKTEDELITEEDYAEVIESSFGLRKGMTESMEYIVILNQVDNKELQKRALKLRDMLRRKGDDRVYLTSFL